MEQINPVGIYFKRLEPLKDTLVSKGQQAIRYSLHFKGGEEFSRASFTVSNKLNDEQITKAIHSNICELLRALND